MNKAEVWLGERMTTRRWLYAVAGVGVVATAVGVCALAAVRPGDEAADPPAVVPAGLSSADQQPPTPAAIVVTVNVGTVSLLDGRAGVTLEVLPAVQPPQWRVSVRTVAVGPGSPVRQIDVKGRDVPELMRAVDDAVRRHDPEADRTVADTRIRAVELAGGEYRYDLQCVGTLKLDADGMADLRRMLGKAQAQWVWLSQRTIPLRNPSVVPGAMNRDTAMIEATR